MSQNPEIQDSATLRERDCTINLVEMGWSPTPQSMMAMCLDSKAGLHIGGQHKDIDIQVNSVHDQQTTIEID
jgi:hypothetical protein